MAAAATLNPAVNVPEAMISRASSQLQGAITVPGDKSISHRALILGALAEGQTRIEGLLEADDILRTAAALRSLGVRLEKDGAIWTVNGAGLGGLLSPDRALDFGNSGTGARLMMGVVAGHPITATFTGDASLCRRPMGRVLDPLRRMGLAVAEEGRTTLPLTLTGTADPVPITYELPVPSAQVKSAILLAGLLASGRTAVIEAVKTRDHTERMLNYFGAAIASTDENEGAQRVVVQGRTTLKARPVSVPGDPSSAAFPTAAAVLCDGSDIAIRGVLVNPTRTGFYTTLIEMGADLTFENERMANGEPIADLRVKTSSSLKGVRVPASRAPSMIDEYPCLAAIAAFAEGETVMEGLSELRVKESDRLAAMVEGLTACGVEADSHGDTLVVRGGRKVRGGARIATHMDHRIAMAFLILGLAASEPVSVDDGSMIATSFPNFVPLMRSLGAAIEVAAPEPVQQARQSRAIEP